jgi:hypothetical protein
LPNQSLDTTNGPTFGGLNITGDTTIGDASGDTLTVNATTTFNNNVSLGSSSGDTLTVNAAVAANTDINFANNGLDVTRGIRGTVGATDYWHFGGGSTASDSGYAVVATGGDGNEPVYVRQYAGTTLVNEIELLDSTGATKLGEVNAGAVSAYSLELKSGGNTLAYKDATTVTTTTTNNTNLLSFNPAVYRSAKITLQITSGSNYNLLDIMYTHDGTTGYITIGNEIIIGSSLATFTAIPGAVQFTSTSATSTRYVADFTLISV